MRDVKRLLAEQAVADALYDDRCIQPPQTDHARHVMDALRLPDYEAAVDALEQVIGLLDNESISFEDESRQRSFLTVREARAILARLREKVPSNV